MILRRLAVLIMLFTVFAVMRPVLACAMTEAAHPAKISAASFGNDSVQQLADQSEDPSDETPSPLEDGSDDPGHSDAGLEDLATLSYEFHYIHVGKLMFPISDTVPMSMSVAPLFRPPAVVA